jgi:hypothetical protein
MKKLLLLLPLLALLWGSCSNEFEVVADWKEIPVVYGMLSPKDTAHYIRVEKAFLDPDSSAFVIAQIPDSLYYPVNAITVYLERVSNGERYLCTRVDGNIEGYVREGGIFASQPNWLYKYKPADPNKVLQPGETYRVVIERADGNKPITGETTLPRDFIFFNPSPSQTPPQLAFSNPDVPTVIEWRTSKEGVFFNVTIRLRYRETDLGGAFIGRDSILWRAAVNVKRTDILVGTERYRAQANIPFSLFQKVLTDSIQATTTKLRFFENAELILEGGGAEIEEYLTVANANSGITGAEIVTQYSNMSEGFGIFTGKNRVSMDGIRITGTTVAALNNDPTTKLLNFRP